MRNVVAVVGVPATGKSTIMKQFMKQVDDWEYQDPIKLVSGHFSESLNTFILGKYIDPDEIFSGTDKLSMATMPECKKYIEACPNTNFVFEGDRLTSQNFLEWILDLPETELTILYVTADERTIEIRHKKRNDNQSEQFTKGRLTKIEGICRNFVLMDYVVKMEHETTEDTQKIVEFIWSKLK